MSTKVKISRKELKEPDKFQRVSSRFVRVLAGNRNLLLGFLVALVVAAGITWFVTEKQKEESLQMEGLYFQMEQLIQKQGDTDSAGLTSKLNNLLGLFQEGSQKIRARLLLAEIHYKNGEYDPALALYTEVKQLSPPSEINHILARQGLAFCYEGQKKYTQAIEAYKSIIDISPKFPLFYIYLGLSRSYQLNQDSKNAILILREMQNRFPSHAEIRKVLSKIKELEGQK